MTWLNDHLPHLAVATLTGTATATVDHLIARAQSLIPNSAWQLAKAIITNAPIRAQQNGKGVTDMSFLTHLEEIVVKAEELAKRGLTALDNVSLFVEKAAPLAAALAPLAGSAAPAVAAGAAIAEEIAPAAHEIIQQAEAASPTAGADHS